MHHLGVPAPVASVEEVQHLLLELLAVFVNSFSCLPMPLDENKDHATSNLFSRRQINLFRHCVQTSQQDRNLPPPYTPLLLQGIQSTRVPPRELIVVVDEVVCRLRALSFDVDRLKLFTCAFVRTRSLSPRRPTHLSV